MRKSVLLIGNFLSGAVPGARWYSEDMAVALRQSGWTVYTTSPVLNRFLRIWDMMKTIFTRRSCYDVAQVSVFSGNAFVWAEAACAMLRALKKPYALTLHGGDLPPFSRTWPGRVTRLLRSTPVVTCPSRYLFHEMRRFQPNLMLLPNALELSDYRFKMRSQVRPNLVWVRAFHSIYNPRLAPRVVAQLTSEFPTVHLTMIGRDKGDGSLLETQQAILQLHVEKHVTLLGAQDKDVIPDRLAEHDIFLNTTNVDNTPVSVLEAMASGLCVVSTNVGGLPYLLNDKVDSLLVPPDNPDAMAAAVRRLLKDSSLAKELSTNGRQKTETLDWSTILPKWNSIFLNLLNRPSESADPQATSAAQQSV